MMVSHLKCNAQIQYAGYGRKRSRVKVVRPAVGPHTPLTPALRWVSLQAYHASCNSDPVTIVWPTVRRPLSIYSLPAFHLQELHNPGRTGGFFFPQGVGHAFHPKKNYSYAIFFYHFGVYHWSTFCMVSAT